MQERSHPTAAHPRLRVHPSAEADRLKRALLAGPPHPADALRHLHAIAAILIARWASPGGSAADAAPVVPLFVLRGGLVLWQPWLDVRGPGPMGVLVPFRTGHAVDPAIVYGSVPDPPGARYVLLDVALASGRTALAACRALAERVGPPAGRIDVIAPFVADRGRELLLERAPGARIHCIWHDERVDGEGRMVGPGFDIGEFALGNSDTSLRWASGREP
ncbi:uracil phosphoribosyltransferase [Streptomyces polyrhachis]|uniref:Uracil phosphoribosyltransferase n=1 Tax=Streptomyces polyrhachis TaxID=1282885 RepID=A0ABW2GCF8_9ACTN